jgi:hypothetical protein
MRWQTSFVKFITSKEPQLDHVSDRTIGIDHFPLRFSESSTASDGKRRIRAKLETPVRPRYSCNTPTNAPHSFSKLLQRFTTCSAVATFNVRLEVNLTARRTPPWRRLLPVQRRHWHTVAAQGLGERPLSARGSTRTTKENIDPRRAGQRMRLAGYGKRIFPAMR